MSGVYTEIRVEYECYLRNPVGGFYSNYESQRTYNSAANEWQCQKCGKIHSYYVGSCGCGEPRPASVSQSAPININRAPQNANRISSSWDCPKCGNIVSGSARICTNCGQSKPRYGFVNI